MPDSSPAPSYPTLREDVRYWLRLGCISFGGPAGQIAVMHRELVKQRRWISDRHFLEALNFCMLLPGPEAQQLATYLGWRQHGWRGGVAAGALFVLPSVFILFAFSWLFMAGAWRRRCCGLEKKRCAVPAFGQSLLCRLVPFIFSIFHLLSSCWPPR